MKFPFDQRRPIGSLSEIHLSDSVVVCGFVDTVRDHGGVIFFDLRDETDKLQVVAHPENKSFEMARHLRLESSVGVCGILKKRPEGTENPKLRTGRLELDAQELVLFSSPDALPFTLSDENVDERVRLTYRFLDLRRKKMQNTFRFRSKCYQVIRRFLVEKEFIELETPTLISSTPEGARDFLVPSRFFPGKFYALPQSPQLFKQLFMISGFERYFQIVRCFRDEDLRLDRQPEFTQLDMEMAYCDEKIVREIVEELLLVLFKETLSITLKRPFPELSYKSALETYGTDKPDLRTAYPIRDLSQVFEETRFNVFRQILQKGGSIKGVNIKTRGEVSRSFLDNLTRKAISLGARGLTWFAFKNGEISSPVAKFLSPQELSTMKNQLKAGPDDLLLLVADKPEVVHHVLSSLVSHLAELFSDHKEPFSFCWITGFPLFEYSEEETCLVPRHHPFTRPVEEDLTLLETDPLKVRSTAYDLVLNGNEIAGGSLRIYDPKLQEKVFRILGFSKEEIEKRFGFFLKALRSAAPPHGGIALGLDRLLMIMLKKSSIREVIAFPKTQTGTCLLSGAPKEVEEKQLKELRLKIQ